MDPRSLRLTNRLNNDDEQLINIDSRVIADRQNIRRLDNEMARQEQFTNRQEVFNESVHRSHNINIAIFVLLGIVILVVLVIAALAYHKSSNAEFAENSIDASELNSDDSYTMRNLKLTGGGNGTLTIQTPGGITFGASQITADEFRVIDGAIAGTVVANKAMVVDSNKNVNGLNFLTAGGASFSSGVCFQSLLTANTGMSVKGGVSFTNLVRFYDGMIVTGGTSFNNRVNFYDGMSVGGTLYSYGGLSVSGTTNFSNLITVESNTGISIQGGISMSGAINMYSQLNSTSGICILGGLSVSGTTDLYGTTRIAKIISLETDTLTGVSTGYDISLNQSGHDFLIDYTDNEHIQFTLPSITSTDTGHNYNFIWTRGQDIGEKYGFELVSKGRDDTISGTVCLYDNANNTVEVLSSNTASNTADDYRFDLGSMVLDGSKLSVKSYKGRWILEGQVGVSNTPSAFDGFQNHNYKNWVVGGTSYSSAGGNFRSGMLFSSNGKNWFTAYHVPSTMINYTTVNGLAFGYDGSGASIYVGVLYDFNNRNNHNIIYSATGTSWQYAASNGSCFAYTGSNVNLGNDVAFGQDNLGNNIWVAAGRGSTGYNSLLFSTNGTCWMNAHTSGDKFGDSALAVAFGQNGSGSCLWVAGGNEGGTQTTNANKNIMYSSNGMSWTRSNISGTSFNQFCKAVAFGTDSLGNYLWVAGGYDTNDQYRCLQWSSNGTCWAISTGIVKTNSYINSVAYGLSSNGVCSWVAVAAADSTGSIFYSHDGMSWTRALNNTYNLASATVTDVAYGMSDNNTGLWVATVETSSTAPNYNSIIYSVDLKNWYPSQNGRADSSTNSVAFNRPLYPNAYNLIDDIYT